MQSFAAKISCLITFLFLFAVQASTAQQTKDYIFTHYTKSSGIISHQVNTIVQDNEGYMWLGTTNGLQRFDGIRFKSFVHIENDETSLPSNPVWQAMMDKKNNLWLLMADGTVGIFDRKQFVFHRYPSTFKNPPSPNTSLKRLVCDEQGNLFYIIAGSEVITWNEKAQEFSYRHNFFKQKDNWRINDFAQQPGTRHYWMAIEGVGLAVYNAVTNQLSYPGSNTEKLNAVDRYREFNCMHLFFDNQHRLWTTVIKQQNIFISAYQMDSSKFYINNLQLSNGDNKLIEFKRFFQQKDGPVWVYGFHLLAKYLSDKSNFQSVTNGYQFSHSIAYEMVHSLYEDREKNIWVCTDNNGLYRFNPENEFFTNVSPVNYLTKQPGESSLLSFAPTKWGSILAGTYSEGLYEYDKNFNQLPVTIKGLNAATATIWCMTVSKDSSLIWMGTKGGFYSVDEKTRAASFHQFPVLANSIVRQISVDKDDNLWLGTDNIGILKINSADIKHRVSQTVSPIDAIPQVQVNKLMLDKKNRVWIGTPENGLYVLDAVSNKLLMHFGEKEKLARELPERGISSILEYNDSMFIITTATRVVVYNEKSNKLFLLGKPGFVSGFITAVEKDDQNYLWLTSTSGLYHISVSKRIFAQYEREDGIDNDHFTQSASCMLPDGHILFGSTSNILVFDPKKMQLLDLHSDIVITDVKVMNKPLNVDSVLALPELELSYKENSVMIELSQLMYSGVNLVKYRMEGLETEWHLADKDLQAVYSYLPTGRFNFLVTVMDENGKESPPKSLLIIKVNSPVWKSWWFYSLVALGIGALLFWLDRERMSRKQAIQQMRADIGKDLHQEVNTALGNITILSEMARLKTDTEPGKSKEFIEQIQSRSRNMMASLDDMLWTINPDNDSTEKMMLRLKEFIEGLKIKYNVQAYLLVDKKAELLDLNMKQRKDIFWLYRGGIENVIKCGGDNCRLHITYERPTLIYTLEFDIAKVDLQQLTNLRQRNELTEKLSKLKATLDVETHKMSHVFILKIPVL